MAYSGARFSWATPMTADGWLTTYAQHQPGSADESNGRMVTEGQTKNEAMIEYQELTATRLTTRFNGGVVLVS